MSDPRVFSTVVPCIPERIPLLRRQLASIATQDLGRGWSLQLHVQEDEPRPTPAIQEFVEHELSQIAGDRPFSSGYDHNEAKLGPGLTRNLAFGYTTGELFYNADDDDWHFDPLYLRRRIKAFEKHPEIQWSMADPMIIYSEGHWEHSNRTPLPQGVVDPGVFVRLMVEHGEPPGYTASAIYRREALVHLGGYPDLPWSQDIVLMGVMSQLYPGYSDEPDGWGHVRHATNRTNLLDVNEGRHQRTLTVIHKYAEMIAKRPGYDKGIMDLIGAMERRENLHHRARRDLREHRDTDGKNEPAHRADPDHLAKWPGHRTEVTEAFRKAQLRRGT